MGELLQPGRILSRLCTLDFMKLGFRFLAPLMRNLIQRKSLLTQRTLRVICGTLSWLLVHSESDDSQLLADSLRPMVSECTVRSFSGALSPKEMSALLVLAACCGCFADDFVSPVASELRAGATLSVERLQDQVAGDVRRGRSLTKTGYVGLASLGFELPDSDDNYASSDDEDDAYWEQYSHADPSCDWHGDDCFGTSPGAVKCDECGQSLDGTACVGEGYFENLWYCLRCWEAWQTGACTRTLSAWSMADGHNSTVASPDSPAPEQRGAAALLLKAPASLRCGVSGALLTGDAVRIPALTNATTQNVAFHRRSLERWYRRSGGLCPVTGHSLDLRGVESAPDLAEAVTSWLQRGKLCDTSLCETFAPLPPPPPPVDGSDMHFT